MTFKVGDRIATTKKYKGRPFKGTVTSVTLKPYKITAKNKCSFSMSFYSITDIELIK